MTSPQGERQPKMTVATESTTSDRVALGVERADFEEKDVRLRRHHENHFFANKETFISKKFQCGVMRKQDLYFGC